MVHQRQNFGLADRPSNRQVQAGGAANPGVRARTREPGLGSEASWNEHLVADVALLLECDAIYLLKDWGDSRGSRIEANIAEECGLQIVHQPEYATYESRM